MTVQYHKNKIQKLSYKIEVIISKYKCKICKIYNYIIN